MDSLSRPLPKYVVACLWFLTNRQFIRNNRSDLETTDLKGGLATWDVTKLQINQQLIKYKIASTIHLPFLSPGLRCLNEGGRHDVNIRFDQSCDFKCKFESGLGSCLNVEERWHQHMFPLIKSRKLKYKCKSSLRSMAEEPRTTTTP